MRSNLFVALMGLGATMTAHGAANPVISSDIAVVWAESDCELQEGIVEPLRSSDFFADVTGALNVRIAARFSCKDPNFSPQPSPGSDQVAFPSLSYDPVARLWKSGNTIVARQTSGDEIVFDSDIVVQTWSELTDESIAVVVELVSAKELHSSVMPGWVRNAP